MFIANLKMFLRDVSYLLSAVAVLFLVSSFVSFDAKAADSFSIDDASWNSERNRLSVSGLGDNRRVVTVTNAVTGADVGNANVSHGKWRLRVNSLTSVPCRVRGQQSDGQFAERDVSGAPANCDGGSVINNPPTANNDAYTVTGNATLTVNSPGVLANDSDDGLQSPLVAVLLSGVSNGSLNLNANGSFSYTANSGFSGDDTFTYAANDGQYQSTATVTITVLEQAPVNTPPVANDDSYSVGSATLTVNEPGVLGNDSDDGLQAPLVAVLLSNVSNGNLSLNANGSFSYTANANFSGEDSFTYAANDGQYQSTATVTITVQGMPSGMPDISINSTSQNGRLLSTAVAEQPLAGQAGYSVFAVNDLGMHCGDFDTRISSILPPFNVLHAQVIRKGSEPEILNETSGIGVVYSASSNPFDPVLAGVSPSGEPLLSSVTAGNVYKTNFWDLASGSSETIALKAYRPFYPPGVLDAFAPVLDQGLPMPDVERLYLGDGVLAADQQAMPGSAVPYIVNDGQSFGQYVGSLPFFLNFPFGYTSSEVNWYEAAGIPLAAFDDAGRENPYPLYRVQAHDAGGSLLASVDTVAPISGEANCQGCHGAPIDGGNGAATKDLSSVATTLDDPMLGVVPLAVSKEYAADINILTLHDQKHGTMLVGSTPVVCQTCHYTPALDLAQVGPLGPENDAVNANGRDQAKNKSMSNVMHSHHASVTGLDGEILFPSMPPPVDASGKLRNPILANDILQQTCYQCHPGRRTSCLRGAMASGGMLCQDCHGDMAQVGDDFSRNVSADNVGAFELADNFYSNPATPRVPWANEPGCGSCHTGDALTNMHGNADTIGSPDDGIRLMQAWKIGDARATPIVPTNKRFAEPTVAANGNPQLYRVSTGHQGVLCESCHGATHAIFPNANPNANDNVASIQLQGHAGLIGECSTCHSGDLGNTLDGPHGMHAVGNTGFANGGHHDAMDRNPNACRACHGQNGEGTVLSAMFTDRVLSCDETTSFCPNGNSVLFPQGHQVTCTDCHGNEL